MKGLPHHTEWIPFILGLIILLGEWASGRDAYQKKQQKEIERMKGKDLR
ncbi:putative kinase [Scopulibacillus daqui]|uniref:Kinase n=2 Tax=Scopulibacillus daqui TaxID=1469162 RepID=A0ABS2Q3F1_9BACL|nr:hypothetical protein [Scopulibacillus daqui]MBM7646827.1 putative kinase [Scopulibacillus daqui]